MIQHPENAILLKNASNTNKVQPPENAALEDAILLKNATLNDST
jgi:hypothetical protein